MPKTPGQGNLSDEEIRMIVFFDTEIALTVDSVGGWENVKAGKAGLSAAVTLEEPSSRVQLFDIHTVGTLADVLEEADAVVSFYGSGFDVPLISSLVGKPLMLRKHLDLCEEIKDSVGKPRHGAWGLDAICKRTLGYGKPMGVDGAMAPIMAQQGRMGEVFNYCLGDVYLLRDLFDHIRIQGWVRGTEGEEILLPKLQEKINALYA